MSRPTDTGETRRTVSFSVSPTELEALKRVQRERGDASLSATIRAIPEMWYRSAASAASTSASGRTASSTYGQGAPLGVEGSEDGREGSVVTGDSTDRSR